MEAALLQDGEPARGPTEPRRGGQTRLWLLLVALGVVFGTVLNVTSTLVQPRHPLEASLRGLPYPSTCVAQFPNGFKWAVSTADWGDSANSTRVAGASVCRQSSDMMVPLGSACARMATNGPNAGFGRSFLADIAMLSRLHVTSFALTLSWSMLMTWDARTRSMRRNDEGIAHYRQVLHELRRWYIEPVVTLHGGDIPPGLKESVGGWPSRDILRHFVAYARLAFEEFSSVVALWFTFNDPWALAVIGYGPDAWAAAHNVLLCHAGAVQLFRAMRSQDLVPGHARISLATVSEFGVPLDVRSAEDVEAAAAYNEHQLDWFLMPVTMGKYPETMRATLGGVLPEFSIEEAALVKGSVDGFIGIGHYTTVAVTPCGEGISRMGPVHRRALHTRPSHPIPSRAPLHAGAPGNHANCSGSTFPGWAASLGVTATVHPAGSRQSPADNCAWFAGWPDGFGRLLDYVHQRYAGVEVFVTELGWCGADRIDDRDQVWGYQTYLGEMFRRMSEKGIPLIGFTTKLMDEHPDMRMGLWWVDFGTMERIPKTASMMFSKLAQSNCLFYG